MIGELLFGWMSLFVLLRSGIVIEECTDNRRSRRTGDCQSVENHHFATDFWFRC